jgi:hypothetical protein
MHFWRWAQVSAGKKKRSRAGDIYKVQSWPQQLAATLPGVLEQILSLMTITLKRLELAY